MTKRKVVLTPRCLTELNNQKLNRQETAALWALVISLPEEGEVVNHAELGRALELDTSRVTKAMKRLMAIGFITRESKVGVSYSYRLNPDFFKII